MKKIDFIDWAFITIFLICAGALIMMTLNAGASTRPWDEEDYPIVVNHDQREYIVFGEEETCPVQFTVLGKDYYIMSSNVQCLNHAEIRPGYSKWPPFCELAIAKKGLNNIEYILYSTKCYVEVILGEET